MRIRRVDGARQADLLGALHTACMPADDVPDFSHGWWWVGTVDGVPAAFAGMTPVASWPQTAYLKRSGVLPQFRGNGYQKRLIRVRLAYARRLGMERVVTDTAEWNYASSNSLIACGFRLYEPQRRWSFGTALYWVKKL
jgi:RimJ/RimL family protein N-acetyltransferase